MSVVYPLSPPTTPAIRTISMRQVTTVGMTESPFTLNQQVQDWGGDRWEADIELPPMVRADAEKWITFLVSLRGKKGTFYLGMMPAHLPQGSSNVALTFASGTVGQPSITLTAAGTCSFVAGDYYQQNHPDFARLYKILNSNSRTGSGNITLDIFPVLRSAIPVVGAAGTTQNPVGLFRLSSNKQQWDIKETQVYGLRFSCVEAL